MNFVPVFKIDEFSLKLPKKRLPIAIVAEHRYTLSHCYQYLATTTTSMLKQNRLKWKSLSFAVWTLSLKDSLKCLSFISHLSFTIRYSTFIWMVVFFSIFRSTLKCYNDDLTMLSFRYTKWKHVGFFPIGKPE